MKKFETKNFLLLTIAGLINAFGVTFFLAPVKLYDSGISGTSMLLSQITPNWMSLSVFLILLNVPLFVYGLKKQGIHFTVYAIYTVAMYSLFAFLINDVLPVDVSMASPLAESDLLLCALFGGLISGAGSGLAIRFGGAMDGIEVLAVIFAKRIGITVGTFVMVYNVILYVICGLILQSWILPLYSIVAYMAALKTVDFIVEGFDRSKAAMIVTACPDDVCKALSEEFGSGMTLLKAQGFYSGSDMVAVYFIVNRFQVGRMKSIVHECDPKAYISITEVANVYSSNADK
ncbi:MAG: YitT family protein [Clostridia bacterium]|nr:YitT family protein [Clostridia bacterium]